MQCDFKIVFTKQKTVFNVITLVNISKVQHGITPINIFKSEHGISQMKISKVAFYYSLITWREQGHAITQINISLHHVIVLINISLHDFITHYHSSACCSSN